MRQMPVMDISAARMVRLVAPACSETHRNIQSPAPRRPPPPRPFPSPLIIVARRSSPVKISKSSRESTPFPSASRLRAVSQPQRLGLFRQVLYHPRRHNTTACYVSEVGSLGSSRGGAFDGMSTISCCLSAVLVCCLWVRYLRLSLRLGSLNGCLAFKRRG